MYLIYVAYGPGVVQRDLFIQRFCLHHSVEQKSANKSRMQHPLLRSRSNIHKMKVADEKLNFTKVVGLAWGKKDKKEIFH